jgi:non-canonical purine NTP pyrophosphatase (RdgB/HAM1 family)
MQRIHVESSDVVSIGYDPKELTLEVEFKGGRVYDYYDVEPDVYKRFMAAESFGEYFFASISKHYRYKRINDSSEVVNQGAGVVTFVSGNSEKLRSLRAACDLFSIEVEQLDLPIDEIQSHEPQKIALYKAKHAHKLANRSVLIQDTFWNILALRGFPGAYMHDVVEWFGPKDFLLLMQDKVDRTVIRTHTLVYYDGKRSKIFTKDILGTLTVEPRGTSGVSIDKLTVTDGQSLTNAEVQDKGEGFTVPIEQSAWYEFAKWYNLQRRLGRV